MEEGKEIGFGDLELVIRKPALNADSSIAIAGNFEDLAQKIQVMVDRYKGTELTESNVSYVKTLKGHFTSLRTGIERERKEYKKAYITPASKLIDSMCDELQAIVAEGEEALGSQLEAYDQKRKDELTVILREYVADSVARHGLREVYAVQVQLKDKYYNKTQNEEDSADDIELQCAELERKQKEYDSGVMLIKAECEDAGFLSDSYIRELQYKSATEIIMEIKADRKVAQSLPNNATIGKPVEEMKQALQESSEPDEGEKRERVLRVRYTANQAKLMADFFKSNGIEFEFVKSNF